MKEILMQVRDLSFRYGKHSVIENVSFDLFKGDYLGVVGPNGSGKTTLLKLCLGLIKKDSGTIKLFDKDLENLKERTKLAYISQKSNSFNMGFPATVEEVIKGSLLSIGYNKKDANEMMGRALNEIGIENIRHKRIGDLSGGQQQKAFIAKAIASNPEVIFLDEPTVGIDQKSQDYFYETMGRLNKEGVTLFMVSHDISAVTTYSNRVICIGENTFHIHEKNEISDIETSLKKIYGKNMGFVTH